MVTFPFGIDIFSFVPALGAVALSFKNWLTLRRGAVINPNPIINYGVWGKIYQEKKNKVLFFPIMASNDGSKTGMISDLKISLTSSGKTRDLEIRNKVKIQHFSPQALRGMARDEFKNKAVEELNPFFPIAVNSKEDTSFMVECYDSGETIPVGEKGDCTIELMYGNGRKSSVTFPFLLSNEDFDKSLDVIRWLRN